MAKDVTNSKRYGFALEYAEAIARNLFVVAGRDLLGRTWSYHRIWYDPKKDKFLTKDTLYGLVKCTVSDEDVFDAIAITEEELNQEIKKNQLLAEYGDAVNYFYNNAYVDNKGIFVKKGVLGKKYFTAAELDELQDKYLERMDSKVKRIK